MTYIYSSILLLLTIFLSPFAGFSQPQSEAKEAIVYFKKGKHTPIRQSRKIIRKIRKHEVFAIYAHVDYDEVLFDVNKGLLDYNQQVATLCTKRAVYLHKKTRKPKCVIHLRQLTNEFGEYNNVGVIKYMCK